jgi:hypothetical protein
MSDAEIPSVPPRPEDADMPESVGVASMRADGTLEMQLRTVAADGTIGESMLLVGPKDPRHAQMVKHLGGIKPGQGKPIPPFVSG